jgi:hypothetical protein
MVPQTKFVALRQYGGIIVNFQEERNDRSPTAILVKDMDYLPAGNKIIFF